LFEAEDTLRACLAATASVVAGITIHEAVTREAASGLLLATDVADYLVGKGLPFRSAHEVVGAMVRTLVEQGRGFESLTMAEWRGWSELFDADVQAFITPAASVARKRTPQSTHPDAVAAAIRELTGWIAQATGSPSPA
jgi:argininosuccinate lyase